MRKNKSRANNLTLSLIVSFCLSFSLFIFAPVEIYCSNSNDFWFELKFVMPAFLLFFAACFAVTFLLCFLFRGRLGTVILSVLFALAFASYIQGNFLAMGYPELNGESIDWENMRGTEIVSMLFWGITFVASLFLSRFKEPLFKKGAKIICVIIAAVQVVTLGTLAFSVELPKKENYYFSSEKMLDFSKQGNIITIIPDSMQSKYLTRALEEYPEFKDVFDGFTYFPDTVSTSSFTVSSIPTLFTGMELPLNCSGKEGMRQCLEKTYLFDELKTLGYETKYFTSSISLQQGDSKIFSNVAKVDDGLFGFSERVRTAGVLGDVVYFRYAPHTLKQFNVPNLNEICSTWVTLDMKKLGVQGYEYGYDRTVFDKISSGITVNADKKQYTLIHLYGIHPPYSRGRDLIYKWDYYDSLDTDDTERRYQIALGQLDLLAELVKQLKEKGIYDSTTIIYSADHGMEDNRFNPSYMVKPCNAKGRLEVSEAKIDYTQDYSGFILDSAKGMGENAALFGIGSGERERYVYNYYSSSGYGRQNTFRAKIAVNGSAVDASSYVMVADEYSQTNEPEKCYKAGEKIKLTAKAKNAAVIGIDGDGNSVTGTAKVQINFDSAQQKPLKARLTTEGVKGAPQRIVISSGDSELLNETVNEAGTLEFNVPAEAFDGEKLLLDFKFPDARSVDDESAYPQVYAAFEFSTLTLE